MNNTKWRTGNDSESANENVGIAAAIDNLEDSKTVQSFTDDANINIVMERFGVKDGSLPPANINWSDLDLSDTPVNFSGAMQQVNDAKERFMKLPANVRGDFNHDPAELISWLSNPANHEAAVEKGFLKKLEPEAPAPPVTPPAGGGTAA